MKSIFNKLFYLIVGIVFGLGIASLYGPEAVQSPDSKSPNPAIDSLVNIVQGVNAHLDSEFTLGIHKAFAQEISQSLSTDRPGLTGKLKLYLNGVPMNDLEAPSLYDAPPATVYVKFKLRRNSYSNENRKSWNQFLSGLKVDPKNEVSVGLSFNAGLVHESQDKLLYATPPESRIKLVIVGGLVVLIFGMVALVYSGTILRDGGAKAPYSLGKTQLAWWGLIVALSFLGVFLLSHQLERIPDQTLVLLGISGGTGLLSIFIRSDRTSTGAAALATLQEKAGELSSEIKALQDKGEALSAEEKALLESEVKVSTDLREQIATRESAIDSKKPTVSWWRDITSDEHGPSIYRLQVVVWTVILGCIFIWGVTKTFSMPEFDNTLLLLLGISNTAYLGAKIKEG